MIDLNHRLKTALARVGGRMTRQRQVILEVLEESQVHLTAKDLFLQAHARDPQVTLSTVYRTLDLCKNLGILDTRLFSPEHGPEWYEMSAETEHYHFICIRCGQVTEFDAPEVSQIVRRLVEQEGVTQARATLAIYGVCAACGGAPDEAARQ